ncbi:MAG: DNA polymerase I, partial [Candidatus Latescibacteria bacterium]|nr:DNA polymerase I [Candidatus Latescibacterota bacterium]
MTPRVFLIDGSALAYRAHFAFAGRTPLITSKGEETSAVFGFTNALLKLIRDEHPEYLAVLFDTLAPTFRHQQYEAYKATRREMPSELAHQLPRIDQVIEAFRIPVIRKAGYEADDIMGTLAKQAVEAGLQAVLVSGDKDFLQLVTEDIRVLTFRRGSTEPEWIGPAEVRQRFGVDPPHVVDVLALMGDQSDNVPGVPKIGEKTAIELIQQFGSVQGVLDHVDQVAKKAVQESLRAHVDQALQSLMLVTIETHVPLDDVALDQLAYTGPDYPALQALFRELEFVPLLQTVQQIDHPEAPAPAPSVAVAPETTATVITDLDALDRLVARLAQCHEFAIDLETTSAEPMLADPVGVAVAVAPGEAFYIPVGHLSGPSLDRLAVWERLRPILEDPNIGKCGQNIKYDLIVLRRCGVDLRGITFDTMIAAYLLEPARRHDLGALSLEYLTRSKRAIEGLIGTGKNQRTMAEVPVDAASRYACEDADLTLQLRRVLEPRLDEHGLRLLFDRVEMPLLPVLAE